VELHLRAFIACTGTNYIIYLNNVHLTRISLPDVDKEIKQTCPALHDFIQVRESNDSAVVYPTA